MYFNFVTLQMRKIYLKQFLIECSYIYTLLGQVGLENKSLFTPTSLNSGFGMQTRNLL